MLGAGARRSAGDRPLWRDDGTGRIPVAVFLSAATAAHRQAAHAFRHGLGVTLIPAGSALLVFEITDAVSRGGGSALRWVAQGLAGQGGIFAVLVLIGLAGAGLGTATSRRRAHPVGEWPGSGDASG